MTTIEAGTVVTIGPLGEGATAVPTEGSSGVTIIYSSCSQLALIGSQDLVCGGAPGV